MLTGYRHAPRRNRRRSHGAEVPACNGSSARPRRPRASGSSGRAGRFSVWQEVLTQTHLLQHVGEDSLRREILLCNISSGVTMGFVIGVDRVDCGQDIFHRVEAKETAAGWNDVTKARFLCDDWLSGCQILGAAFTEPAAAQAD